ncbi:DNA-binding transcriptional MerR regulator [Thermocatellispora tengchongensis]|uniref:DNA-binding transcriptional MerR regulator n=2 Tax=Thermocatellispora tengchongensis TaxID=1073253 RepID=A0A840PBL3_9ACTN|nr:MerR family transcriptional regulator [Thermocatellispora tengchongensis]MBB5136389.1 DNA-binding transcriptional MerR regulator [Thermocatellispora tengchongensis]
MTGKNGAGRRWSIGELARASGVTVRALRHYDEIGLVRAGERTASGHRRYTAGDVRRLYRVRALRALGLPLEEIREALATPADALEAMRALLAAQLLELNGQAERLRRLTEQVRDLMQRLDQASLPDPEDFMTTLETMAMLDGYFTPEQREELAGRRAELGAEAVEQAKARFAGLVEQLLRHVQDGTPTDDPQVQDLVRRWDELGAAFHGDGDSGEQTAAAARRMWREHSEELGARLPWPAEKMAELVAYLESARATH